MPSKKIARKADMSRQTSPTVSTAGDSEGHTNNRGAVWIPTHLRDKESGESAVPKAPQDRWSDRFRGQTWGRGRDGRGSRGGRSGRGGRGGHGRGHDHSPWTDHPENPRTQTHWASNNRGKFIKPLHVSDKASPPSLLRHPLGPLIESLKRDGLTSSSRTSALRLANFEHLTSYNWLDTRDPSIAVPGTPRLWSRQSPPRRLPCDTGVFYRDHEARNHPSSPMQPAIEALLHTPLPSRNPPAGLMACSNTLFNLYCFAAGEDRHFRMLVETIGGVVHLVRRENPEDEKIHDVYGFGHTFADANMTWGDAVKNSVLHQRIVRHDFAGISTIVRFVADGYLPDKATGATVAPVPETISVPSTISTVTVSPIGRLIPHASLFDLKTRSIRRNLTDESIIAEYLPRLWLCQIHNFVIGRHENGLFTDVTIRDTRPDIARWESEQQENLARFAALLRKIMAVAQSREDGKLEINHDEGQAVLELREQMPGMPSILPAQRESEWKVWLARGRDAPESDSDNDRDQYFTASSDGDDSDDALEHMAYMSDDDDPDYTACSAHDCGYCGRCTY